tara:strand:- start:699 stop:1250 length:552 start_codon:yes stop_codon:yes gene_type:complete
MEKHTLTESFFIKGKIDKVSSINTKLVKNHILSNFSLANRYDDPQYWFMKDYVKVPYHQHIQWIQDYLRDHYRLEYNSTLIPTVDGIRGIVLQTGETVNTHNNVKEWHLNDSPEIDCLLNVANGKKTQSIVFEYDDGRNKHRRWRVPIETGEFILFSSHLNRYITINENKDFSVNLSLHFQLL